MGRPTKLSAKRRETIVDAVRSGASRRVAAAAAGVAGSTLQAWLARGETKDAPKLYHDFAERVREAEAEAEVSAVATIREAAADDWRAAAFMLERKYPERWGRTTRHEVSGPGGDAINVAGTWDLSRLTAKELDELQNLAEKAGAGADG